MSTSEWKSVNGPELPQFGLDVEVYSDLTGEWEKGRRTGAGWIVSRDSKPFRGATHWRPFVAPDENA